MGKQQSKQKPKQKRTKARPAKVKRRANTHEDGDEVVIRIFMRHDRRNDLMDLANAWECTPSKAVERLVVWYKRDLEQRRQDLATPVNAL